MGSTTRFRETLEVREKPGKCESALLITLRPRELDDAEAQNHLIELKGLVETLDITVIKECIVPVRAVHAGYLIGTGKAQEIAGLAREHDIDLIVFDDDLSPSQQRNLEKLTGITVIDRHEVILDIFAERATTREAVLQVGLARMVYSLPRLTRAWTHLSRQRGGSKGTRGEGETQLEVDRRIVLKKIDKFKKELEKVRSNRKTMRKKRRKKPVPTTSIVGYTNAGKSSLLNALAGADVLTADKLFATLDPTTRHLELGKNQEILITDTVGFIRKLPHDLVDAFKSTLEETNVADFLIHVLDASSPEIRSHYTTTCEVLKEIGTDDKPVILVCNKTDLVDAGRLSELHHDFPEALFLSTHTQEGLGQLREAIRKRIEEQTCRIECEIPHDRHDLIAFLHRNGELLKEDYHGDGIRITARIPVQFIDKFESFMQSKNNPAT